jgi:hypothetical protein
MHEWEKEAERFFVFEEMNPQMCGTERSQYANRQPVYYFVPFLLPE